jgi:hypothetical protein
VIQGNVERRLTDAVAELSHKVESKQVEVFVRQQILICVEKSKN